MFKLLAVAAIILSFIAGYQFTPTPQHEQPLGVALPQGTALFETSLQDRINSTDSSMTLVANSLSGGESLSGYNCFTLDEGRSDSEYVCGTVSGTSVTSLERGLSLASGTTSITALKFAHRKGADVKVTDFPLIQRMRNQANGSEGYPNALYYDTLSTSSISSASNRNILASAAYVDFVGSTGCANANSTTRGCVELATALEQASSSSTGSSGAFLAMAASNATSSPSGTAAALFALILNNAGKIAQSAFDLTQLFTFTGGVTSTGTTTISASSTSTNPLVLNGIPYRFPPTQGATNTVLATNGNGLLSWQSPQISTLLSTSSQLTTGQTSTTTLNALVIPAGTLTVGSSIQVSIIVSGGGSSGSCWNEIDYGTGTATTTGIFFLSGTNPGDMGQARLTISATSTTGVFMIGESSNATAAIQTNSTRYSLAAMTSINTAATTYIGFATRNTVSGTCSINSETVTLIHS